MAWLASIKSWLTPQTAASEVADCYAAIVHQARSPIFYEAGQVPDTPQGRFEMVMLHAFLVMHRLHADLPFNQALFDLMFADFDINLRELGVGDLGVGKRVKSWAQAYQGRAIAYDAGLADAGQLADALNRNIYAGAKPGQAAMLAHYMQAAATQLTGETDTNIMAGMIQWPHIEGQ